MAKEQDSVADLADSSTAMPGEISVQVLNRREQRLLRNILSREIDIEQRRQVALQPQTVGLSDP
ncbi:hypothetical protein [Sporisorium scitamineum]|uniref:Uncharacterized protein n=1 Tax=Sporisorium scitamineum TaxID=49012 RepID=A0A0F7RSI2_9BASI|nr:hypothetical protein [Sporisorium scitamineum]